MNRKQQAEIGQMIKSHRIANNLTQLDLSLRLGYENPQFLSILERGLANIPYEVIGQLTALINLPEKKILKILIDSYEEDLINKINQGKQKALSAS